MEMTNGVDPEERVARREIDIAIGAFMGPARLERGAARSSALLTANAGAAYAAG
jgi:hypothetical protein